MTDTSAPHVPDELDDRIRALQAERARPVPRPPSSPGNVSLVGLQRLLDLQADELATDPEERDL